MCVYVNELMEMHTVRRWKNVEADAFHLAKVEIIMFTLNHTTY